MPDMNENAETQQEYFGKAKLETDYKDLSMILYKENAELKERVREQSERISELTQKLDDIINRFE